MSMYDLIKIAKNDSYELTVNREKKLLVISYLGIWDSSSQLENYTSDTGMAVDEFSGGFNALINLTQYRGGTTEYVMLHIESLKLCLNKGLKKVAVVLYGNPMLKVSIDYIFKVAGINPTYFNNSTTAEIWLSM